MQKRTVGTVLLLSLAATAWAATPTLTLTPDATCYTMSGATVTVDINFTQTNDPNDPAVEILGGQFFLAYDPNELTFASVTTGEAPFTRQVYSDPNTPGQIDYAVGIPDPNDPNTPPTGYSSLGPVRMARIMFTAAAQTCGTANLVTFRSNPPFETRLTKRVGANGSAPLSVAKVNLARSRWTGRRRRSRRSRRTRPDSARPSCRRRTSPWWRRRTATA